MTFGSVEIVAIGNSIVINGVELDEGDSYAQNGNNFFKNHHKLKIYTVIIF